MSDSSSESPSPSQRRGGDVLSQVMWASFFILAGLVFLAHTTGYLPQFQNASPRDWIILGTGIFILLDALIRTISPDFHSPTCGRWLIGGMMALIGVSAVFGLNSNII